MVLPISYFYHCVSFVSVVFIDFCMVESLFCCRREVSINGGEDEEEGRRRVCKRG